MTSGVKIYEAGTNVCVLLTSAALIAEFQVYVYFSEKTGIRENNDKKEEEASKLMRNYDFETMWNISHNLIKVKISGRAEMQWN